MEEKKLSGSQIEVLSRAFQNSQIATLEFERVNEMILQELEIPENDWRFWVFTNNFKRAVNQKLPNPIKGDEKDV